MLPVIAVLRTFVMKVKGSSPSAVEDLLATYRRSFSEESKPPK